MIKYISPTSLSLFEMDKEEFYLKYVAKNRPPRDPQTEPMAVGSGFDAYVKAYLQETLKIPGPSFEEIFESQVEVQNRDFANEHGKYCFEHYKNCGALGRLIAECNKAHDVRLEGKVLKEVDGIPLLGIPDFAYTTPEGVDVVHDWKVNGYCSKSNTSPKKGYCWCMGTEHKQCELMPRYSLEVNGLLSLDEINDKWAKQLTIYGWVLGYSGTFIGSIDQIVNKGGPHGTLRTAQFRHEIDESEELMELIREAWDYAQTAHDETLEEYSDAWNRTAKDEWEDWYAKEFLRNRGWGR